VAEVVGTEAVPQPRPCSDNQGFEPEPEAPLTGPRPSDQIEEQRLVVGTNATGAWEERNMMPWVVQRLESLLAETADLRVPCGDGHVRVTGCLDIEGFASVRETRGKRRHLFDLSLAVTFEASWLADCGKMAMQGLVNLESLCSELGSGTPEDIVCGMDVDFAWEAELPSAKHRTAVETALPPGQRVELLAALGANHHEVAHRRGLMYLVHCQLWCFVHDFTQT